MSDCQHCTALRNEREQAYRDLATCSDQWRRTKVGYDAELASLRAKLAEAERRAGEAEKVVAKLPKDAEGKPVVPWADDLWHPQSIKAAEGMHPGHAVLNCFIYDEDNERWLAQDAHDFSVGGLTHSMYAVSECYSTRERALEARSTP